jgi:serine/threonine protein kinase
MNQEELDHFMNLLISCLRFNPKLRITPEQVIDHPWFLDQRPDQIELIDARRNELPYEVNKQILQLRKTVLTPFIKKINTWLARKVVDVPYDLRDLTHAIRMFDRSLISLLNKPISSQLAQDLLHLSIYTAFKYFHPLDRSYEFRHLYRSPTPYKKLVVIQRQLIVDYLDNVIFSPTIYEAAHTPEREFDRVAFTRGITLILKGTTQGKLPSQLIQV